jgi:hypothetical protein
MNLKCVCYLGKSRVEISLTGYFNDSTIRTAQLTIQPKTNILDIINLEDMSLPPDSNKILHFLAIY